jgi:hypothetical protein
LLKSRYQSLESQKKLDKALQLFHSSSTLRAHNRGLPVDKNQYQPLKSYDETFCSFSSAARCTQ